MIRTERAARCLVSCTHFTLSAEQNARSTECRTIMCVTSSLAFFSLFCSRCRLCSFVVVRFLLYLGLIPPFPKCIHLWIWRACVCVCCCWLSWLLRTARHWWMVCGASSSFSTFCSFCSDLFFFALFVTLWALSFFLRLLLRSCIIATAQTKILRLNYIYPHRNTRTSDH